MTNIIPNNNAICDLKCKYTFNYKDMNANISKISDALIINLSYDSNNISEPVTYDSDKYNIKSLCLFYPSSNKYNGKQADAELFLIHESLTGGNLFVCIPIMISNETSKSSILLGQIIDKSYTNSLIKTKQDIKTQLSNKINLNELIPIKKYYADKGSVLGINDVNIIIFSIDDTAYMTIKQEHYEKLKKVINKVENINNKFKIMINNKLFINLKGPTISSNNTEDDIYIDCKPYIEEEDIAENNKLSSNYINSNSINSNSNSGSVSTIQSNNKKTFKEYMKSPLYLILFIIIISGICIIILWGIFMSVKKLKNNKLNVKNIISE